MGRPLLEICVDRIESALAAQNGGANRLEVCGALALGGTTPSNTLVSRCRQETHLETMMMIRPDDGDFCYRGDRIKSLLSDISNAKALRVDGVVFGCLTNDNQIDVALCEELLAFARPLTATFHRAFDLVLDPLQSLDQLIDLGFDNVLTSGLQTTAPQGEGLLAQLHQQAKGEIQIIAGSGINPQNVSDLIRNTGITHVHASASHAIPFSGQRRDVSFGETSRLTSVEQVQKLATSLSEFCS